MARKILFDISQLKSERLQGIADSVDMESKKKYRDGKIDDKEIKKLSKLLSGRAALVEEESDDIKAMLGFTKTAPAAKTEAKVKEEAAVKSEAAAAEQASSQAAAKDEKSPYDEVRAAFDKARGYDAKNNTYAKTIDEAYEAVEKDKAFSDKKYKDALKQLKYDRKHSIADAEAQEVRRKASLAADDKLNIVNESALKYQDEDDARDAQIEYIKKQNGGKIDKRVKKALRNKNQSAWKNFGLWFSGNYSAGKQNDISTSALNRAAEIANKAYDKKGVLDIVGSEEMLNKFMAVKLISYDKETETYNIKNLSLLYLDSIGIDATINEHDVDVEAEIKSFKRNLDTQAFRSNKYQGFKEKRLTNDEILDLGKNLGYYDNHYHGKFVRTWQKTFTDFGKGAMIGGAAGASAGRTNVDIKQHSELNISMDGFTGEDKTALFDELASNPGLSGEPVSVITAEGLSQTTLGQISETALGIIVTQDQMLSGTIVPLWKHIALGAVIGGAVGAGMGIIEGLASKGREKEAVGFVFDCELTYEELLDKLENEALDKDMSEDQIAALKRIALLGYKTEWVKDEKTGKLYERFVMEKTENGECKPVWDYCTFIEKYNKMRGNQIFNANEVRMAALTTKNRMEKVVTEDDCAPKSVEPKKQEKTTEQGAPVFWAEKLTPEDNMNVRGHSWDSLATLYDCFPKDINKAKRMLKVMQGMQGKKLTVEQITELAEISRKEVHIHYLRDNSGRVVKDKYGNPKFDVEDAKKQLEKAFEGKLPEGYNFNYKQCAIALCASVPGDNGNMIIAPQELAYNDPKLTPCHKQAVHKPKASNQKAEVGNRGNAGKVGSYRNAVKDGNNPVQPNVSMKILEEAKKVGKPDQSLLNE